MERPSLEPTAPEAGARRGNADRLVTALAAGVAMLLAVVATRKGPGLSPDSVGYLSTGMNIAGSDGLVMLADQPLTIFPPGLPMIAALGETIGLGAETTLRIVSIASFGAIVALASRLIRLVVTHRAVALGAVGLLAVSPVLLGVSRMAWSEPPFLVVTLLFLLVLGGVWERGAMTRSDAVALIGLCWMAFLLRYAGTSLIGVGGIALLLAVRPLDRRALGRIVGFGVLSASVPIAWMLRNHGADGTYLGNRSPSQDSLREVGVRTAATFGQWLLPNSGAVTRPLALLGAAGALLAVAGLAATLRGGSGGSTGAGARARLLACAVFVIVYLAYMTTASLNSSFEPTNSRYLSPVYVPGVAIAAAGIAALLARRPHPRWRVAIGAIMVVLLAGQLGISIRDTRDGAIDGIGYNSNGWVESEVAAATSRLAADAADPVIYSNEPNALWAATRLQPIRWAPRDVGFRGAPLEGELDAFVNEVACTSGTSYLVLYLLGSERAIALSELKTVMEVERVAVAADGAIFRITAERQGACGTEPRPTQRR